MRNALYVLLALCALTSLPVLAAEQPAVLFYGGVHPSYVAKPLAAMGFAVDVCPAGKLAEKLATGKYNVAVVSTLNDAERKTIDDFLARGGGVFMFNPEDSYSRDKDWTATNEWLTQHGARPRWELLKDSDEKNLYRDIMGCRLSWSTDVKAPVNDGVRGVLTLTWESTTGLEPVMSFDFSPDWQIVVRGAATLRGVPEKRQDVVLQPWVVKELAPPSPPLLGIRALEKGRLAVVGIRAHWLITSPPNCPTTEAMLTAGAAGKPSDWLRVFANTFRWLAEPAQKAGMGGATTPDAVLNPPPSVWEKAKHIDWSAEKPVAQIPDEPQTRGLIGARTALSSGTGTVADYVKAAKAAGLNYIVFMEDSLKMDQAKWDQLVAECKANSDDNFVAFPGLTYEDAQGDHLYAFADNVKMLKPEMLLPDGRLATVQPMRSRAYFDYDNEYLAQEAIRGYWNHRANMLHFSDYKLYNSFPIYSFLNGQKIDDALGEFLYLQGIGGCQAALAFEFMTDPGQVARRAAEGWKVVVHRPLQGFDHYRFPKEDQYNNHSWWYNGAWSFSGSGSQYITNGPQILVWQSPNRLCEPRGEWWRPDIWEYRLQLRVASDVGLKSVTIYDGDRQILRRYQPNGAKTFEQELILANSQQMGPTLVVEDVNGHKAVSMSFWNRNLNNEEFFCSDRCNFLGNARLRTREDGQYWTQVSFRANMGITPSKGEYHMEAAPAVNLTKNSPTLPVDGAPAGFPTLTLNFYPQIPGEIKYLYAYPQTYLVSPEIGIGQADVKMAFDPREENAKFTPLGHAYIQPQQGEGNAWGGWHQLIPTTKVEGWQRVAACTWLTEGFRLGWVETNLRVKTSVEVPEKGIGVTWTRGELWKDGKKIGDANTDKLTGAFDRGVFCTLEDGGGAVVVIGTGNGLTYEYSRGNLTVYYRPKESLLMPGEMIHYTVLFAGAGGGTPEQRTTTAQMLQFAKQFGVLNPGKPGYTPKMLAGRTLDTYLLWRADAGGSAVRAQIAKTAMPGFLPATIDDLHDNWSVYLLDNARKGANFRMLPIRDGRAYAQLDLNLADSDLFIGHPVTADNPNVTLLVSWKQENQWVIEAHNPTDAPITAKLATTKGWTKFAFTQTVTLAPGASQTWTVAGK